MINSVYSISDHMHNFPLTYTGEKLMPSIVKLPEMKMKPFPNLLKYAFLGINKTLPVIISSVLSKDQETRPIDMLKKNIEARGTLTTSSFIEIWSGLPILLAGPLVIVIYFAPVPIHV